MRWAVVACEAFRIRRPYHFRLPHVRPGCSQLLIEIDLLLVGSGLHDDRRTLAEIAIRAAFEFPPPIGRDGTGRRRCRLRWHISGSNGEESTRERHDRVLHHVRIIIGDLARFNAQVVRPLPGFPAFSVSISVCRQSARQITNDRREFREHGPPPQ